MEPTLFSREAEWLLGEKYQGRVTSEARDDLKRLSLGEPVDYLIGSTDFLGCCIDLSFRPLIPRPETEYWASKAIQEIVLRGSLRCLDLFAGSGCVGVAVLAHCPKARVDFGEKEESLLPQIEKNAEAYARRFSVAQTDIFSGISGRYEYILANPPYVSTARAREVQPSVLAAEPMGSLFAGSDGLSVITPFLKEAPTHLVPGGVLYLEFDPHQKQAIDRLLKKFGYASWKFSNDQYGRVRFLRTTV